MNNNYFVYILASSSWSLYVWVTNNLERRILEHKIWLNNWFSKKYWCSRLVYFENWTDINSWIAREKQIKKYSRIKKINLIISINPTWKDLSHNWF